MMFKKTPHNRAYCDIITNTGNARTKRTNTTHDKIDTNSSRRSFIQLSNDLFIEQRIHLTNDISFFPILSKLDFTVNKFHNFFT